MGNSPGGDTSKNIQLKCVLKSSFPKHSETDFRCDKQDLLSANGNFSAHWKTLGGSRSDGSYSAAGNCDLRTCSKKFL